MNELPQIPGYRIDKKIGQGGMADVYLGVQENLDRQVAIKILLPALFRDQQFAIRFLKEARTAAKMVHPNIITIHDVGEAEGSHYIVMEYLEESLQGRLKRKAIGGPDDALRIIRMVAQALDYAHQKGFIHRDIKPDNIMFRPDGTAVLVDFGIARAVDSNTKLTGTGMSIGTPHYMSPEQCRGEQIDGRTDIYALGVQFYELLTGDVPYKAENTTGIILKHIQEPIPKLPARLAQYQRFIDQMMAKDRDLRIQSAAHLISAIDSAATTGELAATAPGTTPLRQMPLAEQPTLNLNTPTTVIPPPTGETATPKKRALPAILTVVILVLSVGIVYLVMQGGKGPADGPGTHRPPQHPPPEHRPPGPPPPKHEPGKETQGRINLQQDQKDQLDSLQVDPGQMGKLPTKNPDTPIYTGPPTTSSQEREKHPPGRKHPPRIFVGASQPPPKRGSEGDGPRGDIETIQFQQAATETQKRFNATMSSLSISVSPRIRRIYGQVEAALSVDRHGQIYIQPGSAKYNVTVEPNLPRLRKRIMNKIRHTITTLRLPAPKDTLQNPVRIEDWQVKYKLVHRKGEISLQKKE